MFGVLSVLLVFVLLSFGGVLRHSWLAVEILWIAGIGVVLAVRLITRRSIDLPLMAFICASGFVTLLTGAKIGVGLMAVGWAFLSAYNGDAKVVRFFRFLLLIGILEALLGLVQYFLIPGWIFGYQNASYKSSGTLINRNHFAGLLEMLIPVALGLAYSSVHRFGEVARPYLYLLAGAFMGLALSFSASRMGIFSFFMTTFFLMAVLQLRKSQRRTAAVFGFALFSLVVAGALWIGVDSIVQRYSQLAGEDAVLQEPRLFFYQDVLRMIAATPGGVGTGNFENRFRQYQTRKLDYLIEHAHNDYLETAAEWGLPVAAAFWSFLIFVVIRGARLFVSVDSPEQGGVLLACTGAIFSILLHSLTDFNLQIPSNAMLFFTFVGISLALPLKEGDGNYKESTN